MYSIYRQRDVLRLNYFECVLTFCYASVFERRCEFFCSLYFICYTNILGE